MQLPVQLRSVSSLDTNCCMQNCACRLPPFREAFSAIAAIKKNLDGTYAWHACNMCMLRSHSLHFKYPPAIDLRTPPLLEVGVVKVTAFEFPNPEKAPPLMPGKCDMMLMSAGRLYQSTEYMWG